MMVCAAAKRALAVAAVAAGLVPAAAAGAALDLAKFDTVFGFGDSYTAFGWGASRRLIPAKQEGLGYSGGPTWLQHLANATAAPADRVLDFAIGGATSADSIVNSAPYVPDLVAQVNTFLDTFDNATVPSEEWTSDGALFAVYFGTNDVTLPLERGFNVSALVPAILASLDSQLARLSAAGARHFLLPNLTPLERTPRVRRLPPAFQAVFAAQVAGWNAALAAHVGALPAKFPGASFTLLDFYALAAPIYEGFEAAGFESDSYCAGYTRTENEPAAWDEDGCVWPLREYLWRDDFHLSTRAHELLAQAAVDALASPSPSPSGRLRRALPRRVAKNAGWNARHRKPARPASEPW